MIGFQDENFTDCEVAFPDNEHSTPVPSVHVVHENAGMKEPEVVAVELFDRLENDSTEDVSITKSV